MTKLKLIRQDKNSTEDLNFHVIAEPILIVIVIAILAISKVIHPLLIFFLAIVLLLIHKYLVRKLYPDWIKNKDITGEVSFNEDSIQTNSNQGQNNFTLKDFKKINLNHNYIKGHQFSYKDFIHNGVAELTLTDFNDSEKKLKFLIETKAQLSLLKDILSKYYSSHLTVKEEFGKMGFKTILLKRDSDYSDSELKELKARLKVNSFY